MQRVFQQSYHVPGTLSADLTIRFAAPFDLQLVHLSAVASNNSDATLTVGTSADADGYVVATAIGDSGVPAEWDEFSDFSGALAGGQFPHIAAGTVVALGLDHDGASGTAAQDVTLVLTFTEG